MPNLSDLSRKAQVRAFLIDHLGEWVDGVELANEQVGGSEGLKRLRELRDEGYLIQKRQKPGSDQYQYRLVEQAGMIQSTYQQEEAPNGGDSRSPDFVVRDPHPREPSAPRSKASWGDWKIANATLQIYTAKFKIEGEELKAEISLDMDGQSWLWGIRVARRDPEKHKGRIEVRPERRYGHRVDSKAAAIEAVDDCIRRLKEHGLEERLP